MLFRSGNGFDKIRFQPSVTVVSLIYELPAITSELRITGRGHSATQIHGGGSFRIFNVVYPAIFTLSRITLKKGGGLGANPITQNTGGAMRIETFTAIVDEVRFLENTAERLGGAIFIGGASNVEIINSSFENNSAVASNDIYGGGAIAMVASGASLSITNTTFEGNIATFPSPSPFVTGPQGGALFVRSFGNLAVSASIKGSTFSGNKAVHSGGAIRSESVDATSIRPEITITDSTFVYNTANTDNNQGGTLGGNGGGISGNDVSIQNTFIALNKDLDSSHPDLDSSVISLGFNRVGIVGAFAGQPSDRWGTAASPLTLRLYPLADNGGIGKSHLSDDAAILDAGNCAAQIDQNGVKRPIDDPNINNSTGGNGCDIGATEFERR